MFVGECLLLGDDRIHSANGYPTHFPHIHNNLQPEVTLANVYPTKY